MERFRPGEWLHVPSFLSELIENPKEPTARGGDWAKAVYWGLIEAKPGRREDSSPRNGFWKLTNTGRSFVRGEIEIQEKVAIYNGESLWFEGKRIGVREALGRKFDYAELMGVARVQP